jgi:hypothetical protein
MAESKAAFTCQFTPLEDFAVSVSMTVQMKLLIAPLHAVVFFAFKLVTLTVNTGGGGGGAPGTAAKKITIKPSNRSAKSHPVNSTVSRTRGIGTSSSPINYDRYVRHSDCRARLSVVGLLSASVSRIPSAFCHCSPFSLQQLHTYL